MKIKSVTIRQSFGESIIDAIMEDGSLEEAVITYYADELHFCEAELVGLTVREAADLHIKKDTAYLRS